MEYTLEKGRPDNTEGRLETEIRTYDLLDRLGIEYWRTDHEAAFTMEACEDIDRVLGVKMCKNLFLCNRQQTAFYLLMMPDDIPFKTKELSAQIGSARLSFGDHDKMKEYLDILPGAMSVLGLMNDTENRVRLLIEERVMQEEYLGCHPCVNTSSLKIRMKDILDIFLPAVSHNATVVRLNGQ